MTPMSDATRVIGQIQRGEVVAGAEGARQIAAKAEAAYGDAWNHNAALHTTNSATGNPA